MPDDWADKFVLSTDAETQLTAAFRDLSPAGKAVVKAILLHFTAALHEGTLDAPDMEDQCVMMGLADGLPKHVDSRTFIEQEGKQVADVARAMFVKMRQGGVIQGPGRTTRSHGCAPLSLFLLITLAVAFAAAVKSVI